MTDLVLIGSSAVYGSVPKDIDFIGTLDSINRLFADEKNRYKRIAEYPTSSNHKVLKTIDSILDCEIAWSGTSGQRIIEYVKTYTKALGQSHVYHGDTPYLIAPMAVLWMLKESHKYKDSVHFEKTRQDVLNFRSAYRLTSQDYRKYPELVSILAQRESETYSKSVKLNVTKDKFFSDDGIDYVVDHDKIHTLIKIGYVPAYVHIQDSENDVMCSKDLWDATSHNTKMFCVLEEAMVISIERGMIPFGLLDGKEFSEEEIYKLFKTAVQKICTRLTSGYFREFAWDNYDDIVGSYHAYCKGYVEQFKLGMGLV